MYESHCELKQQKQTQFESQVCAVFKYADGLQYAYRQPQKDYTSHSSHFFQPFHLPTTIPLSLSFPRLLQRTLRSRLIELRDEQRKNQLLERDVERFRNRQNYLKTISYLKKKKYWVVSERCSI